MPSAFALIGSSWQFFRKQPLLRRVLAEMLFLPMALLLTLMEISQENSFVFRWVVTQTHATPLSVHALFFLFNIAFSLWLLWGMACVLVVGKRIIKSPAGRSRSSFAIVRREAARSVIPLFLTDILRDCITILWTFLFIVPGVIYRVRTAFFAVITVCEAREYRDALRTSDAAVRGHTFAVFWSLLILGASLLLPVWLILIAAFSVAERAGGFWPFAATILSGIPCAFAFMLYLLASVHLYKALKS